MAKLTLSSEHSNNADGKIPVDLVSSPVNGNAHGDQKTTKTAKEALKKLPTEQPIQSKGWGFWSWFGYGDSAKTSSSDTGIDQESGHNASEDEGIEDSDDYLESLDDQEFELQEDQSQKEQDLSFPLPMISGPGALLVNDAASAVQVVEAEVDESKPPFEATAEKTKETGQGWISSLYTAGTNVVKYAAVTAAQSYLGNFAKGIDKAALINEDKKQMIENLNDPQFVDLSDLVSQALVSSLESKIDENLPVALKDQKKLIVDLIEINISRGFANLSCLVRDNQDKIPNYDKQLSFVNLISLLCKKAGSHLNKQELAAIELKYRDTQSKFRALSKELFPEIEKQPQTRTLINQYIHANDAGNKQAIFNELFPDFTTSSGARRASLIIFKGHLDTLNTKSKEIKAIFGLVADDILLCMFPKKLDDLVIPSILQSSSIPGLSFIPNYIYGNLIKAKLVEVMHESYEPLENDYSRTQAWEKALEERVGTTDLTPVIESPTALMVGLTKNFIQTDPRVVKLTAGFLASLVTPSSNKIGNEETIKCDELFAELSQEKLASWIVESVQTTLHTQDPHLLALGGFVNQVFNNLTLGLLAKGTDLVIPENGKIDENHFIKELTDRIVAKFKSPDAGDEITEQFWKDFIQGLPLPPLLEDYIVGPINEKANELKKALNQSNPVVDVKHLDTEKTIKGYKGGEQLLSIIEKVSDQIINEVLEQNVELIETFELGDTVDEMLDLYLPGIQIDSHLKSWFKDNMSVLAASGEGLKPQSVVFIKNGIQAILRKAMVHTIETNFKNNSEAYAAQLLKNIHGAFGKAFGNLDASKRDELTLAITIQEQLQKKEATLDTLKKAIPAKPQGLPPEQQTIVDGVLIANGRYLRATNDVKALQAKLSACLAKLSQLFENQLWKSDQLHLVTQALVIRKMNASTLRIPEKAQLFRANLKKQIEDLDEAAKLEVENDTQTKKELAVLQMLDTLLDMNSEELSLVSQAMQTQDTLKHAEKELQIVKGELNVKKLAYHAMNEAQVAENSEAWNAAAAWLEKTLEKKQTMNGLAQEITQLKIDLDSHLEIFKVLARELAILIGLDQKEKLHLPPFLLDMVWPTIEAAKEGNIARLLFTHITRVLLPALDVKENREKLKKLVDGDEFLIQLAQQGAEEVISRIPDFVTSYKPCAQAILIVMGVEEPPAIEDVKRMEKALQDTMIQLGRKGVAGSMIKPILKGFVTEENEEFVSESLKTLTSQADFKEFTKTQIYSLLKGKTGLGKKEEQLLGKQVDRLVKDLNQFLLNHGKGKITNQDLLNAYQKQIQPGQPAIDVLHVESVLKAIEEAKLTEKIKTVVITPEEVALSLNDFIPGATDLHTLIAPELQAVIVGEDQTFKDNREFLELYIEGMLLRAFIKVAEANKEENKTIFAVLAEKIKGLKPTAEDLKGATSEEVARSMIDLVFSDILNVTSPEDFKGVLLPLQQTAFNKTKEIAYQHLTPLLLPMIERTVNREALNKSSGSKFFGSLCEALSKDVFFFLPSRLKSYRPLAGEIYSLLSGAAPTPVQLDEFVQEITQLVAHAKEKNFTNTAIVEAYTKVAKVQLTKDQLLELKAKLKGVQIKEKITGVIITPEEISEHLSDEMPHMDSKLKSAIANEIQQVIHGQSNNFDQVADFGQAYVEGILVKAFQRIAEKNPPQKGKDSFIVMVEKLLDLTAAKYQLAKGGSFEKAAKELNDEIMKDLLGIDSPEFFAGMPDPLKKKVYHAIKDSLGEMLIRIHQNLDALDGANSEVIKARADLKQFGAAANAEKAYAEILAEDLANLIVHSVPAVLTETGGEKMKGVNAIAKAAESYLQELAHGNIKVAKVILDYPKASVLESKVENQLADLADPVKLADDKQKAADLVSNLIVVPLNDVLKRVSDFEEKNGADFNQKMMGNIFHVVADHLKFVNEAKKLAKEQGRSDIRHEDFVAAAGTKLHPAVPKTSLNYQKTLDAIYERLDLSKLPPDQKSHVLDAKEKIREMIIRLAVQEKKGEKNLSLKDLVSEIDSIFTQATGEPMKKWRKKALIAADANGLTLKELLRQEMKTHEIQRENEFYTKETKALLKLFFPHGKKSLTFVAEEQRGQVWKMFKKSAPTILPIVVEEIFNPDMIDKITLTGLESARDSLNEKIVLGESAVNVPVSVLGEGAAGVLAELLKMAHLPSFVKGQMLDPKTGQLSADMKQSLEATLDKLFNETFIRENLEKALVSAVKRDPKTGDYALKFDGRPKAEKVAEASSKRRQMEKEIARVSRQVVDSGVSYFIRKTWVAAQARFDNRVEKAFGKIGRELKRALDAIFRFVFITIIGTILSVLLWPLKKLIKEAIYRFVSLDQNRDMLLNMFKKPPVDQPITQGHVVYNEDMVYKVIEALHKTIDETLEETPK